MNKAKLLAGSAATAIVALAGIGPAFAQAAGGPFADVPTDHWAYASVDKLQKAGIVIGYPDGTYGGKRAMTRYEFAVAIARLLDKIQPNLSDYYTKEEADAKFATKEDLAGFATKEEVQTLRNLVDEFHTELTTLGVDLDATKKRLAALEGRVTAIEEEMKRVKLGGTLDFYGLGANTTGSTTAFRDQDGYVRLRGSSLTGNPTVGDGNLLGSAQVMHDVDLTVKARLSAVATAETEVVFGNYESYLGSLDSYSGSRSAGSSNLNETESVYKAFIKAPVALPGIGGTVFTVGRIPFQLTPYTLKEIDVDKYFYNDKTDLGNIPVDGGVAQFNLGPLGVTGYAAKNDPVQFFSGISTGQGYGLYAGAAHGAYGPAGSSGGFGNIPGSNANSGYGRPSGQTIAPDVAAFGANNGIAGLSDGQPGGLQGNGAMLVNQSAGARVTFGSAKTGTIGATYLVLAGNPAGTIAGTSNLNPTTLENGSNYTNDLSNFNLSRVTVYGADLNSTLFGLGLKASYTKSDTAGSNGGLSIDTSNRITKDDDAFDGGLSYTGGSFMLGGGYRDIGPYFGAPGYWDHVGTLTNPVDIEGPYAQLKIGLGKSVSLQGEGQFYQGTGDAVNDGGLTTKDKITNFRAGFHFGLTSASNVDLGAEVTQYTIGEDPYGLGVAGKKPDERFYNIGYGYAFNPSSSFKLLYQIVNYDDKGTGFDPLGNQNGGIAAAQFQVKF